MIKGLQMELTRLTKLMKLIELTKDFNLSYINSINPIN